MSRGPAHMLPPDVTTQTIIYDTTGEEIVGIGLKEYGVRLPNGRIAVFKISQNITTVDGLAWNPSLAMRQQDPILLTVCPACRRPPVSLLHRERPTHGLCAHAKWCVDCGIATCPKHRRLGPDRRWRCLRCSRRHGLASLLKPLFFREVEE